MQFSITSSNRFHFLLFGCLCLCAGQAAECSAQATAGPQTPSVETLRVLREQGIEQALDTLAVIVDRGVAVGDLTDTGLPAAAGGIFRALSQLSSDEQYEWLSKWSLPTEGRRTVRILTTPVPVDAPPRAFARALGERPRETSFPVAEVGGVRGLFCSGWMLVRAADDLGRLSLLTSELEKLRSDGVPGAEQLLLLTQIADRRGDDAPVQKFLTAAASQEAVDDELVTLAIAAAALSKESLQQASESALQKLSSRESPLRPLLRIAHASAVQANRGESPVDVLYENRLKYWIATTGKTAISSSSGLPDAIWLTHEDHVLHLAGSNSSVLFCRFPLTGEFGFTCETQEGGEVGTDGGLVYGGLHFEALGRSSQLTVRDADGNHAATKPCPFVRHEKSPTFNRVAIRATKKETTAFETNFHPMWFDGDASKASPWLGLRSSGHNRPVFRNFRLDGTPEIPRQVDLVGGAELRGWESGFFGESQTPFRADRGAKDESSTSEPDWQMHSGVLVAGIAADEALRTKPSWLRYQRPLLEGESIRYEFLHGADEVVIHPAVGRLVFLLQPAGVQVRWITDNDWDWTGLERNHALVEPLNRRGPRTLPLKTGEWNVVEIRLETGKVAISLNDQAVYQRAIDFDGPAQFGFYRQSRGRDAQVRNVVLTGDWPEQLPADFVANPVALAAHDTPTEDRQVIHQAVGEEVLASNVHAMRRRFAVLDPEARFEALCAWVLPNADHRDMRLTGLFVPTHTSPLALEDPAFTPLPDIGDNGSGLFLSPVHDLFAVAAASGKRHELRSRIEAIEARGDPRLERAKTGLLLLLASEMDQQDLVEPALVTFSQMIDQAPAESSQDRWLELTTANRLLHQSHDRAAGDLLVSLHAKHVQNAGPGVDSAWQSHLSRLLSLYEMQQWAGGPEVAPTDTQLPSNWRAVSDADAVTCGSGRLAARWKRNHLGEIRLTAGHDKDFLYLQTPLQGRYTVEADLPASGAIQAMHRGEFCGPGLDRASIALGSFQQPKHAVVLDKPFDKSPGWVRYRIEVSDEESRVYLNGRMVRQRTAAAETAPWFAFRTWFKSRGDLRDVSISGSPVIPDQVNLSASSEGWLSYDRLIVGADDSHWRWIDNGDPAAKADRVIVGRHRPEISDSACERLLRYHRPLFRGESVELDFYYEPGKASASVALGRLALLVEPDGVDEHWITDGMYDDTLVHPGNRQRHDQWQRADGAVPLIAGDWNRLRLELTGSQLKLALNGSLIYERSLPDNLETVFGLFHFADESELWVRNVVLRGDWSETLRDVQTLADPLVASLDASAAELPSTFQHDFRDHADQERYIHLFTPPAGVVVRDVAAGKAVTVQSPGSWVQHMLSPRFRVQGDFDIAASFSALDSAEPTKEGTANLSVRLSDEYARRLVSTIGNHAEYGSFARGQLTLTHTDGTINYIPTRTLDESESGRLRIARRGETAYFLFAQADSPRFRLIGQQPVSAADVEVDSIQLLTVASGSGHTRVIWNDVTVRAQRMKFVPSTQIPIPPTLSVMDARNGQLREIAVPTAGFSQLGSPDWSPDGKQIAYDQSVTGTRDSRIMIVDAAGGEPTDLGFGSMPTFSADGSQIAFSAAGEGVGIMKVDGSQRRIIDPEGWGAQWSPDGKRIAYGSGGNILLWDIASQSRQAFMVGPAATQFDYLYWNMAWSRDGSRIVFKGRHRGTTKNVIAVVSLHQRDRVNVLLDGSLNQSPDFSWSKNDESILLSMTAPGTRGPLLHVLAPDGSKPPVILDNQPTEQKITAGVWSPDGSQIAITGTQLPLPVDWPIAGSVDKTR